MQDCLVACCDGLRGLPEAIEAAQVRLCIVRKVRQALRYVSWKERKTVAADLRAVYGAATLMEAESALERFCETWDERYPAISRAWWTDWERLTVFFDFPPQIRKVIYTTNAIESLNYSLRKVLKKRGAFPTDKSIGKILYLALGQVSKRWKRPIKDWKPALNQFAIRFEGRLPL